MPLLSPIQQCHSTKLNDTFTPSCNISLSVMSECANQFLMRGNRHLQQRDEWRWSGGSSRKERRKEVEKGGSVGKETTGGESAHTG